MTDIPRTLLITHYPPGKRNGSIHHVWAVMEQFPEDLVWFSTKPPEPDAEPDLQNVPVPWAHGWIPTRPSREPFRSLRIYLTLNAWARQLGRDAARFGRRHGVELVWGEMSMETVVAARVAADLLKAPLAISALDHPPTLMRNHLRAGPRTRHIFEQSYRRALETARSHGVISSAMADDYRERYGVEADVLYLGVDAEKLLPPPEPPKGRSTLYIGSVGSLISLKNWQHLITALEQLNDDRDLPNFKILQVGRLPEAFLHPLVETTGWVSGDAMTRALERIDLCFLSIWFEENQAYAARNAFPTKITTYLESQRPIVAFGPAGSTIVRLVEDHGLGTVCTEPDPTALADSIRRLVFDERLFCDTISAMQRATDTYSRSRYLQTVQRFLNRAVR